MFRTRELPRAANTRACVLVVGHAERACLYPSANSFHALLLLLLLLSVYFVFVLFLLFSRLPPPQMCLVQSHPNAYHRIRKKPKLIIMDFFFYVAVRLKILRKKIGECVYALKNDTHTHTHVRALPVEERVFVKPRLFFFLPRSVYLNK